jgi:hypothetical protein
MEIYETPEYFLIDDFLDQEEFILLWKQINLEDYEYVHKDKWTKAWPISDGHPLRGKVYISHPSKVEDSSIIYPAGNAIDILIKKMLLHLEKFEPYVGKFEIDWDYFYCRPYIYPINSGLSWHQDLHQSISGAYTFYCHPEWNVSWGGELLLMNAKDVFQNTVENLYNEKIGLIGSHIDNTKINEVLLKRGHGIFIQPKPNRLVLIKKGILHTIKKVDSTAGNKLRLTLQGFFMKP